MVSRIYVPLMPSKSPMCCSPILFLSPLSHSVHNSVLWMGQERNGLLWQHPVLLGRPGTHSHAPFSLQKKSRARRPSLVTELCHLGEGATWVKSHCSSYPLQCIQTCIIFAPTICWNFSTGLLDFPQGSLVCGWLSKTVFSRGSRLQLRGAGAI